MTDSKYANLPGIAYDQADVYETIDLPESEQFQEYPEEETDSIEKMHISATEAFNKFRNKHVVGKGVDFSDKISHRPRTGYNALFEWELPNEGEKETPLQKYQRLQSEIKELFDEVNDLKEKAKNDEELKSAKEIITQVEKAEKELDSLKLDKAIGSNLLSSLIDPQGVQFKQLESQIQLFKQSGSNSEYVDGVKNKNQGEPGMLKYNMTYCPSKSRMQDTARVGHLEQRLGHLENIIGTSSDSVSKFSQNLKCQGIIEAVQQLSAKVSLIDSNHLDSVESRIASLLHRMDNVQQKKHATLQDCEKEQKILDLFEIVKKIEHISQAFPQTVDRMVALNNMHRQAAEFGKSLKELEEVQTKISSRLDGNKILLQEVQKSFATNLETIKNNLSSLDSRVKKLTK